MAARWRKRRARSSFAVYMDLMWELAGWAEDNLIGAPGSAERTLDAVRESWERFWNGERGVAFWEDDRVHVLPWCEFTMRGVGQHVGRVFAHGC